MSTDFHFSKTRLRNLPLVRNPLQSLKYIGARVLSTLLVFSNTKCPSIPAPEADVRLNVPRTDRRDETETVLPTKQRAKVIPELRIAAELVNVQRLHLPVHDVLRYPCGSSCLSPVFFSYFSIHSSSESLINLPPPKPNDPARKRCSTLPPRKCSPWNGYTEPSVVYSSAFPRKACLSSP